MRQKIIRDMEKSCRGAQDTYLVLVTSDADFVQAVKECKEKNLVVIGIGEKKTPERLRKEYTKFFELP